MRAELPKGPRRGIDGAPQESIPFEESTIVLEQRAGSSPLGRVGGTIRLVCGQEIVSHARAREPPFRVAIFPREYHAPAANGSASAGGRFLVSRTSRSSHRI